MKKLLAVVLFICSVHFLYGQILDPKIRAKRAAENRVNNRVDQGIDKGLDKMEEGIGSIFKKKQNKSDAGDDREAASSSKSKKENTNSEEEEDSETEFSTSTKFDFVPGEKVMAIEDFSQDALGDFPARWNTNGAGTLSKLNNNSSKFLMTNTETVFYPEFISNLPDNFTLEFDLSSTPSFSYYSGYFVVGFTDEANVGKKWRTFKKYGTRRDDTKQTVEMALHPTSAGGQQGMSVLCSEGGGQENLKNEIEQNVFATKGGRTNIHVSIWRQKGRLRAYLNESKIWDIPRAFADGVKISSVYFRNDGPNSNVDAFYISNLRVAVGAPDTRNKLITEGRFVTNGILFDVNSDKIKPESYGVLKDIANVLNENEDVKVKIIGHTDSDGDETANMVLSKKRAASVKRALSSQFGISENRMITDGKGESQPVGANTTAEGKANNRRVEFIKQ